MSALFNMKKITDYGAVFETLVTKTADYLIKNNIKAQILGISGGIDSTVVAVICRKVSDRTGIPLIGRSLPTKFNKEGETTTADLVGRAFCDNYKVFNIDLSYRKFAYDITFSEGLIDPSDLKYLDFNIEVPKQTNLADGNIQARLRMIYLYNLASVYGGLVIDTDNLTENNLGYFTIHGDVGDFNPIGGLWKTEVFELAEWIFNQYKNNNYLKKAEAIWASLQLKPTAGLGITNSDLEEIGAESYDQVDQVLKDIIYWKKIKFLEGYKSYKTISYKTYMESTTIDNIPLEIVDNIAKRHFNSEFKRKHLPIKITRNELFI